MSRNGILRFISFTHKNTHISESEWARDATVATIFKNAFNLFITFAPTPTHFNDDSGDNDDQKLNLNYTPEWKTTPTNSEQMATERM